MKNDELFERVDFEREMLANDYVGGNTSLPHYLGVNTRAQYMREEALFNDRIYNLERYIEKHNLTEQGGYNIAEAIDVLLHDVVSSTWNEVFIETAIEYKRKKDESKK